LSSLFSRKQGAVSSLLMELKGEKKKKKKKKGGVFANSRKKRIPYL